MFRNLINIQGTFLFELDILEGIVVYREGDTMLFEKIIFMYGGLDAKWAYIWNALISMIHLETLIIK